MEVPQLSPIEGPPVSEPSSPFTRIANVITAPREAFAGIATLEKRTALWLLPMIVMIVVSGIAAYMQASNPEMQQKMRTQMREQMDKIATEKNMSAQQVDDMVEMQVKLAPVMGLIGAVLAVPAMWLIMSGIYLALANFILGGETSYSRVLAVFGLAAVIMIIETLITMMLQAGTGSEFASVSLGFLVDGKSNPYVHAILARINPFTFWWLWVMAVGLAEIAGLARTKALAGVVGLWAIYSVAMVVLTGLPFFARWQG